MDTLIEILIDNSNSMGDMYGKTDAGKYLLPDGTTRMALLKKILINHILPTIDYSTKVVVSKFHSIGSEDKAQIDTIFNGTFDKQQLTNVISAIPDNPRDTGGTPITDAVVYAINSLSKHKDTDRKIVLLTDGHETGTGNYQVAAKQSLALHGIPCKIFIVGIAQDSEAEKKSSDLAKHTKGEYINLTTTKFSTTDLQVALAPLKIKVLQDSIKNIQTSTKVIQPPPPQIQVQPTIQPNAQPTLQQPPIVQTLKDKIETVKKESNKANTSIQLEVLENKIKEQISNSERLLYELSSLKELLRVDALLETGIDATTLTIDNEYSDTIRQLSERFLYKYLCEKHGESKVKWLNEKVESYSHHDFELLDDNGKIAQLIECKGTSKNKPTFYLTVDEWNHFLMNKEIYQLCRVLNVDANMSVFCIDNLLYSLLNGQVVPYLLKPEILKEGRVFLTLSYHDNSCQSTGTLPP